MKLTNIMPNRATIEVDGVRYGHVEKHGVRWYAFDKLGETLGDGRATRKSAAEFVVYYYWHRAVNP